MAPDNASRRLFLRQATGAAGSAWLRSVLPGIAAISQAACTARDNAAAYTILGDGEAVEFEAIAERIIPATDTPGARDAGVIYFFDQSFGTFNAPMLPMLRSGLAGLQGAIADGRTFSALSDEEQDALLRQHEDTPFFQLMRLITVEGYFGLSAYGGNKDGVGWRLLGMDPNVHAHTSPFGYYDAEYLKENPDA